MYHQHWGLSLDPFPAHGDPRSFFHSPMHEEALARLNFVVEQRRRVGLLLGPGGSGKTAVLDVAARQLRRRGYLSAVISLLGLTGTEFFWRLARDVGVDCDATDEVSSNWPRLQDRLTELTYENAETVVMLDDVQEAEPDTRRMIVRLAQMASSGGPLTVIAAASESHLADVDPRLLDLCSLRIDLLPLEVEDTTALLQHALEQAGGRADTFQPQAVARIQELSGGKVRRVRQLAELALLAGAGQELQSIDAATVDAVYEELDVCAAG